MPSAVRYDQLYSITREEQRRKVALAGVKKIVLLKDFRGGEIYDEDVSSLKERVEKYISSHPQLSDTAKENLRALKVSEGLGKEEVELLLGRPDKIVKSKDMGKYGATQAWIYKTIKMRAFTIFIIPVFFISEDYFLYFDKLDNLVGIERHSLKQAIKQLPQEGIIGKKSLDAK